MITKKKAIYGLLSCFLVLALGFAYKNSLSADSNIGEFISTKKIEAKINGKQETLSIEKYQKGDDYQYLLTKKHFLGQKKQIELSGFEDDISVCDKESGMTDTICLAGNVGVHSQNIELIEYIEGRFSKLSFFDQSGVQNDNVYSDVPYYNFEKNGENIFLVVDQRNYDTDPLISSIRYRYKKANTGFIFDATENITYNN